MLHNENYRLRILYPAVVFVVFFDPNPSENLFVLNCQGAIVVANSCGPVIRAPRFF